MFWLYDVWCLSRGDAAGLNLLRTGARHKYNIERFFSCKPWNRGSAAGFTPPVSRVLSCPCCVFTLNPPPTRVSVGLSCRNLTGAVGSLLPQTSVAHDCRRGGLCPGKTQGRSLTSCDGAHSRPLLPVCSALNVSGGLNHVDEKGWAANRSHH